MTDAMPTRILIVDDEAAQMKALCDTLREKGYETVGFTAGLPALASLKNASFDLLLADLMMPEMDGITLLRGALEADPNLVGIIMTGEGTITTAVEAMKSGATDYILKPFKLSVILPVLSRALAMRQLRMENAELTRDLKEREIALAHSNKSLAAMFGIAEGLNKATTQREVCEGALERALELPGVLAGWISVVDEAGNFVLLASRNLPPALRQPGAMDGPCLCRRKLLSGELDSVTNILECERLQKAQGDTQGLRFHASVPIWIGEQTLGVMNLVGSERGLFNDDDIKNLYAVGNQLGVALERARLHEHLEQLVEERTAKLAAEIDERKRAEAEIRALSADLERRVEERTRELEAANKELESFSYSVSHDLRAPLRHVDGYIQMLVEDADSTFSSEARRYLKVITDASRQMAELIDDLLAFSRMGRAEMSEIQVELDTLAREAIRDLEMAARERNVAWNIQPVPAVKGDRSMLKQALANLLSNAVKYSRPRDVARVEFGCTGEEDGRIVLFVRDNGVGFDMKYADKLFGVFQRLHRADEFEGTGIGLANVQRIIHRHGGRIWAEAAPDQGATFYFTLKPSPSER